MVEFATRWPDIRLWAIGRAKLAPLVGAIKVSAERNESLASQVVISADPAQLESAVSRQFIITVEAWAAGVTGDQAGKSAGRALCDDVMFTIGDSLRQGPFIRLVGQAGPSERRDDAGKYFYSGTVTITAGSA